MAGKYQNNITKLPQLDNYSYENIFKVYTTGDKNFFYYNIVKKVEIPKDIDENFVSTLVLPSKMPLTSLSFDIYGTMNLWWSILLMNNITNPTKNLPTGKRIKFIKPEIIPAFVRSIKSQL